MHLVFMLKQEATFISVYVALPILGQLVVRLRHVAQALRVQVCHACAVLC